MSEDPESNSDEKFAESLGNPLPETEDSRLWRRVFEQSTPGLRAFLRNRLAQESDVDDCLQVVFVKMTESGSDVTPAARRSWLFRVAANESARIWRSRASTDKMLERHGAEEASNIDPTLPAIQMETAAKIDRALKTLPEAWQEIVRLRIDENMTFQQIAKQLDIPLGTALTRMRRALERLKSEIEPDEP